METLKEKLIKVLKSVFKGEYIIPLIGVIYYEFLQGKIQMKDFLLLHKDFFALVIIIVVGYAIGKFINLISSISKREIKVEKTSKDTLEIVDTFAMRDSYTQQIVRDIILPELFPDKKVIALKLYQQSGFNIPELEKYKIDPEIIKQMWLIHHLEETKKINNELNRNIEQLPD
jgi:hypothetical protein